MIVLVSKMDKTSTSFVAADHMEDTWGGEYTEDDRDTLGDGTTGMPDCVL